MPRILLVDDDERLREMFAFALTSEGFDVAEAGDGQRAFESLRQQPSDLVVSDINMPVMDGYELLAKIRQEPGMALLPVILMTARPAFSGLRKGMGMGADDYLPKPFTIPELIAVVQQQLGKRASLRSESERELQSLRESISLALPHELLTPLNGILGVADLLEAGSANPAELMEYGSMLRVSGERLQRLVQNFLLHTQLMLLSREPQRVAGLRGSAHCATGAWLVQQLARVAGTHERSADLQLGAGIKSGTIAAAISSDHLGKVLAELLDNACKFSSPGEPLRVDAESEDQNAIFTVRDHGRGMPWEHISQLGAYRQFDRSRHAQEGTGLGATIARGLVDLHGGSVTWESAPGRGCTVKIRLPAPGAN